MTQQALYHSISPPFDVGFILIKLYFSPEVLPIPPYDMAMERIKGGGGKSPAA